MPQPGERFQCWWLFILCEFDALQYKRIRKCPFLYTLSDKKTPPAHRYLIDNGLYW